MTLTAGRGPLAPNAAGWFSPPLAPSSVYVEPHPRRVRAVVGERTVIDTESVLLVHRPGQPLSYAFPLEQVAHLPHEEEPVAPGWARVPWDAVETWFEEERRLVNYPPNPYHRVDCRPTERRLRVEVAGETLVDTSDTIIVFETALEARLYVHKAVVRTEILRRSTTSTYCNYKGHATYWSAIVGDVVVDDVAWSYEDPRPESLTIEGCLSFDTARADVSAELPGAT